MLFITKANASLKLLIVVKEKLIEYLKTQPKAWIDAFKAEPEITDEIWANIQEPIQNAMEEFKDAFANQGEFQAFIDAGQYINITAEDIQQSPAAALLARHGLFSDSSSASGSAAEPDIRSRHPSS